MSNAICTWDHNDCFALKSDATRECSALIDTNFPCRDDCPFYKSRKVYESECEQDRIRHSFLDGKKEKKEPAGTEVAADKSEKAPAKPKKKSAVGKKYTPEELNRMIMG